MVMVEVVEKTSYNSIIYNFIAQIQKLTTARTNNKGLVRPKHFLKN
jgi:hypothetical protein